MICIDNINNNKNIVNISINNIYKFKKFISEYYAYCIFLQNRTQNIIHEVQYSLSYIKSKLPYEFIDKIIDIISLVNNLSFKNSDVFINIYFKEICNYHKIYKYLPYSKMNKIYKYKRVIYDFFYKLFSVIYNKNEYENEIQYCNKNINIRIIFNSSKKYLNI